MAMRLYCICFVDSLVHLHGSEGMREEKEAAPVFWREKIWASCKGPLSGEASRGIHTHAITVWEVDLLSVRKNTRTLQWPLERKCQIGTPWPWQSMCEDFLCVLWGQGEEECPITILMHCAYVRFLWRIVLLLHRTFRQKNGWRYMKNNIETQTYTSFFHTLQKKITELWF